MPRGAADDDQRDAGAGRPDSARQRILDAATRIIVEEGYPRLSLQRVAERAEVARPTIYYQFGSKAGLLDGLVGAMELDAHIGESREQDHTFAALLARVTRLWEDNRTVLRSILSTAALDPETHQIVQRHEQGRRQRITELVGELERNGALRAGRSDAVDAYWLLTSFGTYDFLREHTSRSPADVRRLLLTLAADLTSDSGR